MEIVKEISAVREIVNKHKRSGKSIGFVPTMGYLHEGHLSLVKISKQKADFTVMSIFVNKMQFNDLSDFETYPTDLQRDIDLAESAGVDLLFMPDDSEMYRNNLTVVNVNDITDNLCGAHRPGHFEGVFTVVSKLFNIVQPDTAVFGQKDIQQVSGIEKMVRDLNFPIEIVVAPIVREQDGLAMSSRNKHLTENERGRALSLSKSLKAAEKKLKGGERASNVIISEMKKVLVESSPTSIDYISIVDYETLKDTDKIEAQSVIAVAVFYGETRLIDNMIIKLAKEDVNCIY